MSKRKNITKKVRFEVFKRDSFTCQYCGKSAPDAVLEVDHIVPVAKGGDNNITNLITSCFNCNRGKSDRKLSENHVMKKQKEELDKLNKRREQLEMMANWREELLNIENEEADKIMKIVSDSLALGRTLTDTGRLRMRKLIKKYGFDEVLESALISYEKYDIEIAFDKIEPIIKNKKKVEENPELKDLYYIRGILKNKFSYFNPKIAIISLKKAYELGATVESLKEFTLKVKNWSEWKDGINKFIEEQEEIAAKQEEAESYDYSSDPETEEIFKDYYEMSERTNLENDFNELALCEDIEDLITEKFIELYDKNYSTADIHIIARYLKEKLDEVIDIGVLLNLDAYITTGFKKEKNK